MMPILLPVRVRRSVRATTVPATRPAVAPALTARANSAQDCTRSFFSTHGVIVERMAGQEEADRLVFAAQALGRQPALDRRQSDRFALASPPPPPNNSLCPTAAVSCARCARASTDVDAGKDARAVCLETVEGAGGGQAFQHALVDGARIDARGEIREVGEFALAARGDDRLRRPGRRRL